MEGCVPFFKGLIFSENNESEMLVNTLPDEAIIFYYNL